MSTVPPAWRARIAAVLAPSRDEKHSALEDALALCIGVALIGLGLLLLQKAGLSTGGVAGVALVLHYTTGWSVGLLFVLVNAPFYVLVLKTMGWEFTLKTIAVNLMLAGFGALAPHAMELSVLSGAFAAAVAGILLGMGVLSLARHRASVGGTTALSILLQEKGVMRAGKAQALTDCVVLAFAGAVLDLTHLALSVLSALVLAAVLVLNHKPGRYTGF